MTNDERAAALVERGRANLTRVSWRATADAYIDLYERVAAT